MPCLTGFHTTILLLVSDDKARAELRLRREATDRSRISTFRGQDH